MMAESNTASIDTEMNLRNSLLPELLNPLLNLFLVTGD